MTTLLESESQSGRKSAYVQAKIKNPSPKQSLKRSLKPEGICVGRIRTFPFSSDSADNSVTYDVVKNRLSQSEAESLARRNLIQKNQNVPFSSDFLVIPSLTVS